MLQRQILQALERRNDIDQRRLSQVAGVNESSISRYLNGHEELNFESTLKIVKLLFPSTEKEIMAKYVVTQKSRNARYALEYCTMNHLPEPCDQIISSLSGSSNPIDKEWATMYRFIRLQNEKTLTSVELLKQVEVFNPKQLDIQILKTIVKAYIYVDLNDYHSLALYTSDTEHLIAQVKSKYLQDCFKARFGLIMNYVSLYANDVEKARHYCTLVINQEFFEHVKAIAYYHLGHSYLFESYEQAKENLEHAIALASALQNHQLAYASKITLSFIQSYWKIERDFPFELKGYSEKTEYIYYLLQSGKKGQAKQMIESLDIQEIPNWNKGFYYYYLGLIHEDKDFFYHSVNAFRQTGDFFHRQLPLQELRKLKENDVVLNILST